MTGGQGDDGGMLFMPVAGFCPGIEFGKHERVVNGG